METAPNLRSDAYAGTAKAYLRFRPPYPARLLEALLGGVDLPRGAILLDLACGPGRIALALAHRFDRVWAVDLEPEMIAVGRTEGERLGIANVAWSIGAAGQADIPNASVDLITIGEAFRCAGFAEVQDRSFSEPWAWSFETIVGYLRSTSVCSDQALGGDAARLETELRCALGGDGPFYDELRSGYTVARKGD
ncbi:MAG: class I SAM-dependent methyltransferase [Caulobacteraceae bacterium]